MHEDSHRLKLGILIDAIGSAVILALLISLFWLFYLRANSDAFLNQGQLFLIVPLCAFWIWILKSCPKSLAMQMKDLRSGEAHTLEGICHVETHRGLGLVAPLKHYIVVNGFRAPANLVPNINRLAGMNVKLRKAALSGTLLSIEPRSAEGVDKCVDITSSDRERLKLMSEGLSDKLIARRLGLSPSTIRTYNSALFKRIGVTSRQEAVEVAKNKGLIDVD